MSRSKKVLYVTLVFIAMVAAVFGVSWLFAPPLSTLLSMFFGFIAGYIQMEIILY